ncbi:MAG: hypothetical protein RI925_348 [Pseudomonadota bacterium]
MTWSDLSLAWLRLRVMLVKEMRQLLRDRVLLAFIVYAFSVDIFLAASGVSLQLNRAATVVQDFDQSAASRELISRFVPPYFRIDGQIAHDSQAQARLDDGRSMLVLSIPPGFQADLQRGLPTSVQLQVDTTNSVLGFLAASYANLMVSRFGLEQAASLNGGGGGGALPVIDNQIRVWFNPNQLDSWFMGITELLNIVTVFAILLPAAAMVREKERGTVEQLLVSPLSPFQIVFPKVLAMTVVIVLGSALALFAVLHLGFAIPSRGNPLLFLLLTALYVFTTAGLGLAAATVARNLAQVGMLSILILAPMIFLSGAWTPPEAMPAWLRALMYLSPMHYYIDASFGVLLKGQGLTELWRSLASMLLIGVTVFVWGLRRVRMG